MMYALQGSGVLGYPKVMSDYEKLYGCIATNRKWISYLLRSRCSNLPPILSHLCFLRTEGAPVWGEGNGTNGETPRIVQ